jgi:hypothetical protein
LPYHVYMRFRSAHTEPSMIASLPLKGIEYSRPILLAQYGYTIRV